MRECTLLPGQVIVLDGDIRLTVVSIQDDEVRFAITPDDTTVTLTSGDLRERTPTGHFAIPSAN